VKGNSRVTSLSERTFDQQIARKESLINKLSEKKTFYQQIVRKERLINKLSEKNV